MPDNGDNVSTSSTQAVQSDFKVGNRSSYLGQAGGNALHLHSMATAFVAVHGSATVGGIDLGTVGLLVLAKPMLGLANIVQVGEEHLHTVNELIRLNQTASKLACTQPFITLDMPLRPCFVHTLRQKSRSTSPLLAATN